MNFVQLHTVQKLPPTKHPVCMGDSSLSVYLNYNLLIMFSKNCCFSVKMSQKHLIATKGYLTDYQIFRFMSRNNYLVVAR